MEGLREQGAGSGERGVAARVVILWLFPGTFAAVERKARQHNRDVMAGWCCTLGNRPPRQGQVTSDESETTGVAARTSSRKRDGHKEGEN